MKTTLMMLIILYKQNVEIKNLLQKQFSSIYKNLCTYTLQIIRYVLIVLNKKQMIKTLIKQSNMERIFVDYVDVCHSVANGVLKSVGFSE
jgi:hypothetical protein